jgi:hypothetical protein
MLIRDLLREAFQPVTQSDLVGGHAVRFPEVRGAILRAGPHVIARMRGRPLGPRGNGDRVTPA